jgi:glycerophosphoryl diester phosphodiesterase
LLGHHGVVDGAIVNHDMSVRHDELLEPQFLPAYSIFVTVGPDPVSTEGRDDGNPWVSCCADCWLFSLLVVLLIFIAVIYLWNATWRGAPPADSLLRLIAHRGIHQTYSRENLTSDTCTAERISPPTHDFFENTIASMRAAFAAGADIVELDVHPTTVGKFAVFHDWTLDCRTEGTGVVREQALAHLRSLDIGYGYTADGGKTFPLRGKGKGLMPEFQKVLAAFPNGRFLVNFKSNEEREGEMLGDLVATHPEWRAQIWGAYGGDAPTFKAGARLRGLKVWSRRADHAART